MKRGAASILLYELAERNEQLQQQVNELTQKRARAEDPWHLPNIDRAVAKHHISVQQRVELAQLAQTYLFAPAGQEQHHHLRLVARSLPEGIIDWEHERVVCWTTCPEALELAHALYYERDAARAAGALQTKGKTFEMEAKLRDLEQKLQSRIREQSETTMQLTQVQQELKRTQEALENVRLDNVHLAAENAHMLRTTQSALQAAGASASDALLAAKNEFLALAKQMGVSGNTSHELVQVILRTITHVKCLYNGVPTAAAAAGE